MITTTAPIQLQSTPALDLGPYCRPDTVRCDGATDPTVATNGCCIGWQKRLCRDAAFLLDLYQIPWSIDYGTLLGYCTGGTPASMEERKGGHEGGVGRCYWNDKDVDLSCYTDDREKVKALMPYWQLLGYHVRYYPGTPGKKFVWGDTVKIRLSKINKVNVDITFWHRTSAGLLDRANYGPSDRFKGREFPEEWMFPTTRGFWEGIEVNVPRQPELRIAHIYGPNWRDLPAIRHSKVER